MNAILSAPDAVALAALITMLGTATVAALNLRHSNEVARNMKPNGGASMRDVLDRIESKLQHQVIPRLDHGAATMADHADRLAVLEARHHPPITDIEDNQ